LLGSKIRLPISELMTIFLSLIFSAVTVTLLLIEHKIAFTPYTTKCSPNRMTFPGADALDFN
jgi:hypothetical protein